MVDPSLTILDRYRERRDRFAAEWQTLDLRSSRLAHLRFGLALVVAGGGVAGLWGEGALQPTGLLLAGAALVAFGAVVRIHARVQRAQDRVAALRDLNGEGVARIERAWDRLPAPPPPACEPGPTAGDLDLLGIASLRHLIGPAGTPVGDGTLTGWLLAPAPADEIRARQGAVSDLAPRLDLRQDLNWLGRRVGAGMPDVEPFLAWAEGPAWLSRRPWLVWQARALAVVTVAAIVAALAGLASPLLFVVPAVAANLIVAWTFRRPIKERYAAVSLEPSPFPALARQLATLDEVGFDDPHLRELSASLVGGPASAAARLDRLRRLTTLADVRHSGMVYGLLVAVLQWDVHVLDLLERWQAGSGSRVRRWLELLGELEALSALAGLSHDHPHWCRPTLAESSAPRVSAKDLGHPLLSPDACVRNSVELGPQGTFLLVTGSNMSGKSTLLRAVGVNAVLALAGGPVCASELRLPVLSLGTSFRVRDSLEQGLSYFMAELTRLKEVVDLASSSGRPVLYLFDEILLGTNTEDRQVAVRKVLTQLLARGAIGAVATHDLSLSTAEGLAEACCTVHFTEQFEEGEGGTRMTFDYTLRPGLAPTTNALKLLSLVGLDGGEAG